MLPKRTSQKRKGNRQGREEFTDEEAVREIGAYLIHGRAIPNYYFRRELRQMGVAGDRVNGTRPTRWVTTDRQVCLEEVDSNTAAEMFRRIHKRTRHQPAEETHLAARHRLQVALAGLQARRITTTAIAERLHMSTKVVQKQATFSGREDGYTTTCPWETLDRIAKTNWTEAVRPQALPTEAVTPHSITEGEIQHERHRDEEARRVRNRTEKHYIEDGGRCWNCGAGWANMSPEPKRKGRIEREMRCRICSRTAYLISGARTP